MLELIDIRGALLIDNLLHVKRQLDKIRQNQISKTNKRNVSTYTSSSSEVSSSDSAMELSALSARACVRISDILRLDWT